MRSDDDCRSLSNSVSVAIIAGGQSRRMGTDKALLALQPGDPTFLELARDIARTVADDLFVVASDRPEYERFGMRLVADYYPEGGTLGAIATALSEANHGHCLVLACDLPFLNRKLIEWMARQPRGYDVLIPRTVGESRQGGGMIYHTLHAIYGRRCLAAIEEQLAMGSRQIIGFFDQVIVRSIHEEELRAFDPELRSLFNANTPEALAQARAWSRG
jgi:molybdopterin-guanine dinucleotide biosynthesis protein A